MRAAVQVVLLLFLSSSVLAQSVTEFDKLFQEGTKQYQEKNYSAAKVTFTKAADEALKQHSANSAEYRNAMWYLAYIYIAQDDLRGAKDAYAKTMSVSIPESTGLVNLVQEMADYTGKKGLSKDALYYHKKAFRMFQSSQMSPLPGDVQWNVTKILEYSQFSKTDSVHFYYETGVSLVSPSDNVAGSLIRNWTTFALKNKDTKFFERIEKRAEAFIQAKDAQQKVDDWYVETWYQYGKIQKAKGQVERAFNAFEKAKKALLSIQDASLDQKLNIHYQTIELINQTKRFDDKSNIWVRDFESANESLISSQPRSYCENMALIFMYYFYSSEFEKAEERIEKMLPIFATVVDKDHPDYKAMELSYLAVIEKTGHTEKLSALKQSKGLSKKDAIAIMDFENVSAEIDAMGKYIREGNYLNALNIFEKRGKVFNDYFASKNDYEPYVLTLITIASLYREVGNLRMAEENFLKAEELAMTKLPRGDFSAMKTVGAVGVFYQFTGKYVEAANKFITALDILDETRTKFDSVENDKIYYETVGFLGNLYTKQGYYEDAEKALLDVLRYQRRHHKEDSKEVLLAKLDIADLYRMMEYFAYAEMLYRECDSPVKKIFGENNIRYITFLQSFAANHQLRGKYNEAEPMYLKAKNFYQANLGNKSDRYIGVVTDLAMMYYHSGQYEKANAEYKTLNEVMLYKADNFFPALSEREKTSFYKSTAQSINTYNSFATKLAATNSQAANEMFDLQLLTKGMLFKSVDKMRTAVFNSQDDSLKVSYQRWINEKNKLAKVYQMSDAERKSLLIDEKQIEARVNTLEKNISSRSELFTSLVTKRPTWSSVKSALKNGEAAIEIVRIKEARPVYKFSYIGKGVVFDTLGAGGYMRVTEIASDRCVAQKSGIKEWDVITAINGIETKNKTSVQLSDMMAASPATLTGKHADGKTYSITVKSDSVFHRVFSRSFAYAALILRHDQPNVSVVILGNGDALESRYLKYYNNMIKTKSTDQYSYQQYWAPIKAQLTGITKVYLAPDGVYNTVNVNTLLNPSTNKYVIDELDVTIVSNTSDLLTSKTITSSTRAVLVGFPDYYLKQTTSNAIASIDTTYTVLSRDTTQRFMTGSVVSELPGTNVEISKIESVLKPMKFNVEKFISSEATEEKLKQIKSPRILHIATHGFFLNGADGTGSDGRSITGVTDQKLRENPLLRSGLLLAGSGKTIAGQKTQNTEDGILTAYEAMNLDLNNTELVAMSACETGLGEVMAGEGVYGLQRAFRAAGAQSVLMSLWKVDDTATQELMSSFYQEWITSGLKQKAFRQAQMKVRERFTHPYYWGAFVMVGL